MTNNRLLAIGLIGTVVTALCCFTPLLVVLLSAIGLAAIIPALDAVLIPLLVVFAIVLIYALVRKFRA